MKILHQNGFSVDELHPWRSVVNKNLVDSAQAIVLAMRTLNVDPENGANRVSTAHTLPLETSQEPADINNFSLASISPSDPTRHSLSKFSISN